MLSGDKYHVSSKNYTKKAWAAIVENKILYISFNIIMYYVKYYVFKKDCSNLKTLLSHVR